jgi:hypothetical protein
VEKRYQVFVSSTYADLKEERAEVMQALLELDCMPSGMELFPAATEEQWQWIRRVIDESDYYIVILGGRYGTEHKEENLSFTELEYRYAVKIGKPTIAFLHARPEVIPLAKSERGEEPRKKLETFRSYCEQRLCKYWDSPADLGGKVSRSMTQLIKRHPAVGWVRGDAVGDEMRLANLELREEITQLRERLNNNFGTFDSSILASGEDEFTLHFMVEFQEAKLNKTGNRYWVKSHSKWLEFSISWNELLKVIGSQLLVDRVEGEIIKFLVEWYSDTRQQDDLEDGTRISDIKVSSEDVQTIKAQLLALSIIDIYRDEYKIHWSLTDLGRPKILELLTIKK